MALITDAPRLEQCARSLRWTAVHRGLGSGLALNTLLPAVQAGLEEKDTASSSATWAFIRTFGTVWDVFISAAILNSRCDSLASRVSDLAVRSQIAN